jgi:hypothetical protein
MENMLISVPVDEASHFKALWENIQYTPKYFIENNMLSVAELKFKLPDGKEYAYSNDNSLVYAPVKIDFQFAPVTFEPDSNAGTAKVEQTVSPKTVIAGVKSDVDVNIPETDTKNDKIFAVIIANENYKKESKVEFALNDGNIFREYCIKTLGLPEKNVHYVQDATLNEIRGEINWINSVAQAYKEDAGIIFYYAGHGIPDENTLTAYFLPIDGYASDVTTGYRMDDLYRTLGGMPALSVTVFMDACFSGAQRNGNMLSSVRGVGLKPKTNSPAGNTVAFSATQAGETAFSCKEQGHGLFTYFLLKKLQESKGDVTFGELSGYITAGVSQRSIVENGKSQTPTVTPSPALTDRWQNLKLK